MGFKLAAHSLNLGFYQVEGTKNSRPSIFSTGLISNEQIVGVGESVIIERNIVTEIMME